MKSEWAAAVPPHSFYSSHRDADDAGSKFSRSTPRERRCHFCSSSSAVRTPLIVIPGQLLNPCLVLHAEARMKPGGHDEHAKQQRKLVRKRDTPVRNLF